MVCVVLAMRTSEHMPMVIRVSCTFGRDMQLALRCTTDWDLGELVHRYLCRFRRSNRSDPRPEPRPPLNVIRYMISSGEDKWAVAKCARTCLMITDVPRHDLIIHDNYRCYCQLVTHCRLMCTDLMWTLTPYILLQLTISYMFVNQYKV